MTHTHTQSQTHVHTRVVELESLISHNLNVHKFIFAAVTTYPVLYKTLLLLDRWTSNTAVTERRWRSHVQRLSSDHRAQNVTCLGIKSTELTQCDSSRSKTSSAESLSTIFILFSPHKQNHNSKSHHKFLRKIKKQLQNVRQSRLAWTYVLHLWRRLHCIMM